MSKIVTKYPTTGLADRGMSTIVLCLKNYLSSIDEVKNFFDRIEYSSSGMSYTTHIRFFKGTSYICLQNFNATDISYRITNNYMGSDGDSISSAKSSNGTRSMKNIDIPITYAVGINGTVVVWIDSYSQGVCMVFGKYGDNYALMNSRHSTLTISMSVSDTGQNVWDLQKPFNGCNIGTGGDIICQPYYYKGVNTEDIWTFDGGDGTIPWGKFRIGNHEFVRIYSNFALKLN